ncbi:penicillin-binding protein, partial [Patescibacteria group bacterium]|nr:penicillin-binding protein [Patescibacteria group bacterium]
RQSRSYGAVPENQQRPLPRPPKFNIFTFLLKKAVLLVIFLGILGFIFGTAAVAWISRDLPDPNKLSDRQIAQSTKIYDRTGEHVLYEIYQDKKRTLVALDKMNPFLSKAVVAIEDKHFYEHSGIRYISILRAAVSNVLSRSSGGGGASTITQQLIKNAIIGSKRDIVSRVTRKIKELVLAPRLEKKYSKDEILQMYLNEIPFGSTNYGVEAASQTYFQKTSAEISLGQSATLAAMIQRPSYFLNNTEALKDRRDYVLKLMLDQGFIDETQKSEAQAEEIKLERTTGIVAAPHFVLYAKQMLADEFGEKIVDTGGLKVITSLDFEKQKMAEDIVKEMGEKYAKESNANNAALVSLDPKTGQILAMVGSRDFFNEEIDGQFNVAVLGKRQPGSSFKPFVYLYAFEKGYTPETVLYDVLTNFDMRTDQKYIPKNYDGKEHGLVTMRKALQGSLNIPAVKTLYLVGTKNMIDFSERFGYTTFTGDPGLSLVLGGAEVNLLEHTNGYATLANNGTYNAPVSILKVDDMNGNNLYEWKQPEGTEAIKPELAALISNILSDDAARAYMFGRGGILTLPGRPVAAKTGTTNNYFDAWTMGFTPSLATGVWVGNTQPSTMKGGGGVLAGAIWNKYMKEALKDAPVEQFPETPPNDAEKPVLRGSDGGIALRININTGKIAASTTPDHMVTEKIYLPSHDILHYVNKDDPRGSMPADPSADEQYQNWETALQDWIKRENDAGRFMVLEDPPTEFDTPQSLELMPSLEILSPANSSTLYSRQIEIKIETAAPRGVSQSTFYIDGLRVGSSQNYPFGFVWDAKNATLGTHRIKVVAEDDQGNSAAREITIDMQAAQDPPSIEWFGQSPLTLREDDFPRSIQITPFRWDDIKEIKIYLAQAGDGNEKQIYIFNHAEDSLFDGKLMFSWKHSPGQGNYTLRAVMTEKSGRANEESIEVEVR